MDEKYEKDRQLAAKFFKDCCEYDENGDRKLKVSEDELRNWVNKNV